LRFLNGSQIGNSSWLLFIMCGVGWAQTQSEKGKTMQSCRNCGGTDFYARDIAATGGYGPDLLPIGGWWSSNFGGWSSRKLQSVVCGTCGLMELFVPGQHLAKVKETYPRLAKPKE
jgi:predicted nucleic-acid-binding Zn-ribbon protein